MSDLKVYMHFETYNSAKYPSYDDQFYPKFYVLQ